MSTFYAVVQTAINWFESANRYDYGGVYNDFRDDMGKAIKDIFEGTDSSQKIIERAVKAKEKLGEIFSTLQVQNRYRLVAENAVNKARNFAQALAYEELGITRYEISAILDQKTSIVCRTLNGKVFETKTAVQYVNEVLATDPNKVVSKFPWPDPKDFPQTEDDLRNITPAEINKLYNKMSVKLPPYHAFCRTTVIIQQETQKFKMASTEPPPENRQLTSKEVAESKALQELAKKTIANEVDYSDIEPVIAGKINNSLEKLLTSNPNTLPSKMEYIKDINTKKYYMMVEGNNKLNIGSLKRKDTADWLWEKSRETETKGYHRFSIGQLKKDDTVQGMIDHEMGHIIRNSLGQKSNPLYDEWTKIFNSIKKDKIKNHISEYATENADDFFAESYTLYKNGRSNVVNGLSVKVSKYFEKLQKEVKL
ncbi:MAG: hypothetical protein KBF93_27365 [Leptospiraceae bacterium]|nr:hypothetical protein [Leptospiraceae bacterium]